MNQHPYLRAYMAGIVPTLLLLLGDGYCVMLTRCRWTLSG